MKSEAEKLKELEGWTEVYGPRVAYEVVLNGATPIYNGRLQQWEFAEVDGTVFILYELIVEANPNSLNCLGTSFLTCTSYCKFYDLCCTIAALGDGNHRECLEVKGVIVVMEETDA